MPTNSLAVPSPSLRVYWYKIFIWGIYVSKISWLFLHHNILFHLAQLLIHENSRHFFPKRWTGKYVKLTRYLNFHFTPLTVSWWNQSWISFRSNPTIYYSSLCKKSSWVTGTSGKRAGQILYVPFLTIHHHYIMYRCCPYILNVILLTCQESKTKVFVTF